MEFFGISLAAWMSIVALVVVIIISCFNEELNVGASEHLFRHRRGGNFHERKRKQGRGGVPVELVYDPGGRDLHVRHGPGQRHPGQDHVLLDSRLRRQHDAAAFDHLRFDRVHHHDRPGKHRRCGAAGPHLHGHCGPGEDVGIPDDASSSSGRPTRPASRHLPPRGSSPTVSSPGCSTDSRALCQVLHRRAGLEDLLQLHRWPRASSPSPAS